MQCSIPSASATPPFLGESSCPGLASVSAAELVGHRLVEHLSKQRSLSAATCGAVSSWPFAAPLPATVSRPSQSEGSSPNPRLAPNCDRSKKGPEIQPDSSLAVTPAVKFASVSVTQPFFGKSAPVLLGHRRVEHLSKQRSLSAATCGAVSSWPFAASLPATVSRPSQSEGSSPNPRLAPKCDRSKKGPGVQPDTSSDVTPPVKIAFMGLGNSGKTTLARMLAENRVVDHAPTLHPQCLRLARFEAVDLGGHETARRLWKRYSLEAAGIAFLVDATDRTRFTEALEELHNLLDEPLLGHVNIAILAQKMDAPSAVNKVEFCNTFRAEDLAGSSDRCGKVNIFFCSVFQRLGYEDAFDWLLAAASDAITARGHAKEQTAAQMQTYFSNLRCGLGGPLMFTQFDQEGLPTHDTDGNPLKPHDLAWVHKTAKSMGLARALKDVELH